MESSSLISSSSNDDVPCTEASSKPPPLPSGECDNITALLVTKDYRAIGQEEVGPKLSTDRGVQKHEHEHRSDSARRWNFCINFCANLHERSKVFLVKTLRRDKHGHRVEQGRGTSKVHFIPSLLPLQQPPVAPLQKLHDFYLTKFLHSKSTTKCHGGVILIQI